MNSSALQLHRLTLLRWFLVGGQLCAIALTVLGLRVALPYETMVAICLAQATVNAITLGRLKRGTAVGAGELFVQLCIDAAILASLLYFSGGSANPFVSLLLLPLTVAATMLPALPVAVLALLIFGAYTLLLRWSVPLPPSLASLDGLHALIGSATGIDPVHLSHDGGFALHIVGMWINFGISALIVTFFVARLAALLRDRERELARSREQTLRQEQMLALGTLASGAAHRLGTPLSTMAVLVQEMTADVAAAALRDDLALLRQQVDRCKDILQQLQHDAQAAENGAAQGVDILIDRVTDEWRLLRPACPLAVNVQAGPTPMLSADRTLDQALLNLLDNAADASPAGVELALAWSSGECRIDILDRGPGIDRGIAGRLGEPFVTTKGARGGMGLGFFLSNATVERLGGRVELFAREGGGSRTCVVLPCDLSP